MRRPISLAAVLTFLACGPQEVPTTAVHHAAATVPAQGTSSTLDLANWNIEWFGSKSNGPRNEDQQLLNARDVIAGADLDAWGLAEIVDNAHFDNLVAQLPGYAGFLANDPIVTSGSSWYDSGELKLGFLYKTSVITVNAAKVILTENNYDFAGRPPLRVDVTATVNGASSDLVVIVLHMKAFTDEASWQRRRDASRALKRYLDDAHPARAVLVIGDWNDDVDTSISAGRPSPFRNFVDDPARYAFPTRALSEAGISSTRYRDLVDHHLHTDELLADYVAGSAEVYRVDRAIPGYASTTSDHLPVLTRYAPGGRASAAAP